MKERVAEGQYDVATAEERRVFHWCSEGGCSEGDAVKVMYCDNEVRVMQRR